MATAPFLYMARERNSFDANSNMVSDRALMNDLLRQDKLTDGSPACLGYQTSGTLIYIYSMLFRAQVDVLSPHVGTATWDHCQRMAAARHCKISAVCVRVT